LRVIRFPEAPVDARVILGPDWCYRQVNAAAERDLKRPAASLLGRCIWDEYPLLVDTPLGTSMHHVMRTRESYRARQSSPMDPALVLLTTIEPADGGGIAIIYRTIPKAAERRVSHFGT
jgi:hypothetical protein